MRPNAGSPPFSDCGGKEEKRGTSEGRKEGLMDSDDIFSHIRAVAAAAAEEWDETG